KKVEAASSKTSKSSLVDVAEKTEPEKKVEAASSKTSKSSSVDVAKQAVPEKKVKAASSKTSKSSSVDVAKQAAPESDVNTKAPKIAVEKNITGVETISDASAASVEQFALNTLLQKILQKKSDTQALDINVNINVKFDI
ncbi:MAG: hypothetical protein U9N77_03945, partial [Thermodesulfobacteriota bacterium]|nr:hypothetical protein [Thermodesulfobacteriota bacterium]